MRRLALACVLAAAACGPSGGGPAGLAEMPALPAPPSADATDDGEPAALQQLGRRLFHDSRLSLDGRRSCATCHVPWRAFSGRAQRLVDGGRRDVPPLVGAARRERFGWSGDLGAFEDAVMHPFGDADGFGGSNLGLLRAFAQDSALRGQFEQALGRPASEDEVDLLAGARTALSAYVRSLADGGSPFDAARADFERAPLAADAARGWELFRAEGCLRCHGGPTFTDERLRWHGLPDLGDDEPEASDDPLVALEAGAQEAQPAPVRTPSLRDVTRTSPYMHDGRFQSLDEVLAWYSETIDSTGTEAQLRPLGLSDRERADLLAFLTSLESAPLAPWTTGAPPGVAVEAADVPARTRPRRGAQQRPGGAQQPDEARQRPGTGRPGAAGGKRGGGGRGAATPEGGAPAQEPGATPKPAEPKGGGAPPAEAPPEPPPATGGG